MFASPYIRRLFPSLLFGTSYHIKVAVNTGDTFSNTKRRKRIVTRVMLFIMLIFLFIYLSVVHKYVTIISTIPLWYGYNTLKHGKKLALPKKAVQSSEEENMMYIKHTTSRPTAYPSFTPLFVPLFEPWNLSKHSRFNHGNKYIHIWSWFYDVLGRRTSISFCSLSLLEH